MINTVKITWTAVIVSAGFSVVHAMDHPDRQAMCYQFFNDSLIGKQQCTVSSGTATGVSWTAFSMKNKNAQGKAPDSKFVILMNNMEGTSTLKMNGESAPAYSYYRRADLTKCKAKASRRKDDLFCFATQAHKFSVCTKELIR